MVLSTVGFDQRLHTGSYGYDIDRYDYNCSSIGASVTEEQHSKWQRDLAEMQILLMVLGLITWVTFWACVHYGVVVL